MSTENNKWKEHLWGRKLPDQSMNYICMGRWDEWRLGKLNYLGSWNFINRAILNLI